MTRTSENILVLGAYGRLGVVLSRSLMKFHKIYRQGRNKDAQIYLSKINKDSLVHVLKDNDITVVINLIAMTDVAACEISPSTHFANSIIPKTSGRLLTKLMTKFCVARFHRSSLLRWRPVRRDGFESMQCIVSKLAGEYLIDSSNNTCILRTNYFGLSEGAIGQAI